ncbi:MAG: DUF2934 domain-containing protein [Chthoniobacterales bacterium]
MDKKTPSKKASTTTRSNNKLAKSQSAAEQKKHSFCGTTSKDKIAVRAYFISERRRQLGWDGNPESDWMEAEQQLLAEEVGSICKK